MLQVTVNGQKARQASAASPTTIPCMFQVTINDQPHRFPDRRHRERRRTV